MTDVVLGALIGVAAAVAGAVVQGIVNNRLQMAADARNEARLRSQTLVASRLRALDQAHKMLVIGAEFARASALGEEPQQVASLRRQAESSNYLEADVTLVADPQTVAAYLERTRWWLTRPSGITVSEAEITVDSELANRLQAAFRRARERIIGEVDS